MFDINNLKDPKALIVDLYTRLVNIRAELEKRVEESDYYYPSQEVILDKRELDAIRTLVKYIENYDN